MTYKTNRHGIRILAHNKRKTVPDIESQAFRYRVFCASKGRCVYCGRWLDLSSFTIDHVLPKALGGTDDFENIVTACFSCNKDKGCLTPNQFKREGRFKKFFREDLIYRGDNK